MCEPSTPAPSGPSSPAWPTSPPPPLSGAAKRRLTHHDASRPQACQTVREEAPSGHLHVPRATGGHAPLSAGPSDWQALVRPTLGSQDPQALQLLLGWARGVLQGAARTTGQVQGCSAGGSRDHGAGVGCSAGGSWDHGAASALRDAHAWLRAPCQPVSPHCESSHGSRTAFWEDQFCDP